jgi:hypothetical protein
VCSREARKPWLFNKKTMAAGRAAKGKETNLNNQVNITAAVPLQAPARNIPLQEALMHASQVKLLLRRVKARENGSHKSECLSRLLQGLDRICASIEWLGGSGVSEPQAAISAVDSDLVPAGGLQ